MNAVTTRGSAGELVGRLPSMSLPEVDAHAALQTRVDRKYVVGEDALAELLDGLRWRLAALEIDGRREARYRSVYFDTPGLEAYLGAARRRRHRFKVRTRSYLDSGTAMLEVKTREGRGMTHKRRIAHDPEMTDRLDVTGAMFVDTEIGSPGLSSQLTPTLATSYGRTTLVDRDDTARLTIDSDLRCTALSGALAGRSVGPGDEFIVETKSASRPCAVDRWLWHHGIRPVRFSKYGTGLAALDPSLPANKWHHVRRHLNPC
ncbi:MAG: polyphosphate polymerase domain-containing protein [Actinomycetia bacterium]|nr:polyphosphate polymerase domain-containing protein [Actinomycetes bacterium]